MNKIHHLVIPDCQVRPGDNLEFLSCIGRFAVKKKPAVIVNIGDFADMPSLSSYDVGKKSFEGRRYRHDIDAAKEGMTALLTPIWEYNERQRKNGKKQYNPRMILTLGNHEHRISKAVENDAKLDGVLSIADLEYESFGWNVHPFLEVVVVDGVAYSHYFVSGTMGRSCTTAAAQMNKKHMSCVAGHQQGKQIHTAMRADGKELTSIIAGSCYEHDEDYMGPQGNRHWRGVIMLHDVEEGQFDPMFVNLSYLRTKYAG